MAEGNGTPTGFVFLSGGSALQHLAQHLASRGQHATHVISVFDSGGSAGRLRGACDGIAIGDIRKRLTAIGDRSHPGSRPVVDLFASRLPSDEPAAAVRGRVEAAAQGAGELLAGIDGESSNEIAEAFARLLETLPTGFDWCDGSIGNIILTGRYRHEGGWPEALRWAHRRLGACGTVVPVSTSGAHLGARLANGRRLVGQADITSEQQPIEAPIDEIFLEADRPESVTPNPAALEEIRSANAVVYSWGSFYTSVLPSLLVDGVSDALRATHVPKVLLLNPECDAETRGRSPADLVREIRRYAGGHNGDAISHVIALRQGGGEGFYQPRDRADIEGLGVEVCEIDCPDRRPRARELEQVADTLGRIAS